MIFKVILEHLGRALGLVGRAKCLVSGPAAVFARVEVPILRKLKSGLSDQTASPVGQAKDRADRYPARQAEQTYRLHTDGSHTAALTTIGLSAKLTG